MEEIKKDNSVKASTAAVSEDTTLKSSFLRHLKYTLAKDEYTATDRDRYKALSLAVRDRLVEKWIKTQQAYYNKDVKRVYYLSLEFLIGRSLGNVLVNLDIYEEARKELLAVGLELEQLRELEWDPGLGNGGLGRLAACFLDSLATLGIPSYGYGIRYEYGIFFQKIRNGHQVETPDNWLRYGNPWEIERPEYLFIVKFYGKVNKYTDKHGRFICSWIDTQDVVALGYDTAIPGYHNNTVNTMRLWGAKSTRDFDLGYFQHGDYERAVSDKVLTETISKVLYPNDNVFEGKELRLKQEYFFVSATLQDIMRRFKKNRQQPIEYRDFPNKTVIQLNDTHPSIAIAELMRIFIDIEGLDWDVAWEITTETFGYTNHTILPEALERWSVPLFERVLPRHLEIIYEINYRFLKGVEERFPGDGGKLSRMSIIEEGDEKKVRMANLSIVGSRSVNGVSALHSEIIKNELFKDFYDYWPKKFNNKTNGITQRRWLRLCNPALSELITQHIGDAWVVDLNELKKLIPFADNIDFQKKWRAIKQDNKRLLAHCLKEKKGVALNVDSIFDCHFKRMHEYKRQLLNAIHAVVLYNRIKAAAKSGNKSALKNIVPRTVIFGGKAAPGYFMAKLIIKLINSIAEVVNSDPEVSDLLKLFFMENYSVSLSEMILPAAELSEQISTAGTEASGTGNMKFALNGALTIGTLDGANIELKENIGADNIFIFGLTADKVNELKQRGYNPREYYERNAELKQAVDMIDNGFFSKNDANLFKPIIESLLNHGDQYLLMADFESYAKCQERVAELYKDQALWTKMSILNVANMGFFSSDRTIKEYADDIWLVKPVDV
ncbi:glycogen/starch/alpha-glucan phosphorylase [Candidatus Magnetominusculus xianensis]|uniref:Alpha-1,4 glucan phosphorylase n=1 Tax=Candidatus Magnetominusculus xianensis TaxID=1748249 RepID=A0ABR5SBH0_9BACT|nr:glycogen/starch/alpha-glucan phosphorylase [Candidatus Magnetominusculus xianensis]KWT77382.1 glycogen phosphorylase [Candidatus Magnetominusculus xianensis]MBF0405186.1 glycogen/starch/alpha-glucan phosphorylase [Nitrospirota bacterium]